jgi:hypothetical protein
VRTSDKRNVKGNTNIPPGCGNPNINKMRGAIVLECANMSYNKEIIPKMISLAVKIDNSSQ